MSANQEVKAMQKGSAVRNASTKPVKVASQKVWKKDWSKGWKAEDVLFEEGDDLFRPAKPEEVIPNKEMYYFQPRFRPGNFYLQSFSHLVDWKSVVELCENGYLFVRKDFKLG